MGRRMLTRTEALGRNISPEPTSGCWLWDGPGAAHGYGQANFGYTSMLAHRAAWEEARGPIPAGLCVCHKCDNRACVNPDHLFLGTTQDNTADMVAKRRHCHGERNAGAKLTRAQVDEVLSRLLAGESTPAIAKSLGVSRDAIRRIEAGETWGAPALRPVRRQLSALEVMELREMACSGAPKAAIAARFGVNRKTVNNIEAGRTRRAS